MYYSEYMSTVTNNDEWYRVKFDSFDTGMFNKHSFRWFFLDTELDIFSFLTYKEEITLKDVMNFSDSCYKYAHKNHRDDGRNLYNVLISLPIIASENISEQAQNYVTKIPTRYNDSFEIPIIYDLKTENILFCRDIPEWGSVYYNYFIDYILRNFS